MNTSGVERRQLSALLIVLGFACVLRIWGTGYGLPLSYHNDEYHEVMRAFELGAGSFNFGRIGKGGLYLLLFIEYGFYFVALKVLGVVNSAMDFAAEFVRDPSAFYYMGRVTVAFMGTLTVFIAFLIARRAYATGAGLLAAIFLSVDVMHSDMSHKILVDVPMVFFASVALLSAIKLAEEGRARDYIWAAVFASLATTTKIPAVLLLVPLLIAHTYHIRQGRGGFQRWILSRPLWMAAALFAGILIVTNPGIVFVYKYIGLFSGSEVNGAETLLDDGESPLLGSGRPNLFLYYLAALKSSMGWPLFVVGAAGVGYALWKRKPADVVLLSFAIMFFFAISSTTSDMFFTRYVLPVVFIVHVLAGRLVYDLHCMYWRSSLLVLSIATAILIAVPATGSVHNSYLYTQTDTRTLAKEWIEANIPEGSQIFLEGAKIAPVRNTVQLQDTATNLQRRIEYWSVKEPKQAEYLRIRLRVLQGKTYNLLLVPRGEIEDLQYYRDMNVQYFVITPIRFEPTIKDSNTRSAQFLNELRTAPDTILIKRIETNPSARPGPTVEIYGFTSALNDVTRRHDHEAIN